MSIPQRMMVAISGLGFAGAAALIIGVAAPADAATSAAPVGASTVTSAPTWWNNWGCGCWDDCWDDCGCGW